MYEAAFQYNKVLIFLDILYKEDNGWHAFEVKSSKKISKTYLLDAAIQYYVISNSGIELTDFSIVYINKDYTRGDQVDISELFKKESVIDKARSLQGFIKEQIIEEKKILDLKHSPQIDIGSYCYNPYPCDFIRHCWKHIPENSIFNIPFLDNEKKFELYKKNIINPSEIKDISVLNEKARIGVNSQISKKPYIAKDNPSTYFKSIRQAVYFLKVLTHRPAFPEYSNTKPYEVLPYHFAIGIIENNNLEIFNWHSKINYDPRINFFENFSEELPDESSIIIYDQPEILTLLNYEIHINYFCFFIINKKTNEVTNIFNSPNKKYSISDNLIRTFFIDKYNFLTRNNDIFYHHDPEHPGSINAGYVRTICKDKQGRIWIGTDIGGIGYFDGKHNEFVKFVHDPYDSTSLSNNYIHSIYEDAKGNIWIGTNGGLNKFLPKTNSFKHYTIEDGLPNDVIYAILEDDKGNLWLSSNMGISKFIVSKEEFRNYDADYNLQGNEFNYSAYYKSDDGEIFFGGTNGVSSFYPHEIIDNE